MRKYPKKCPKCGEYMEPVFLEKIGRSYMGCDLHYNREQEPIYWKCIYCGYTTKEGVSI